MVRKRLVTVLTINSGVLFRTRSFVPDYRYTLNFVDAWSVDEVVLLDITRPGGGDRESFFHVVRQFARNCFVPLAVGGGVRCIEDIRHLLGIGADKIVLNTGAARDPDLITQASRLFGSQCVVLSIDAKREDGGNYQVYVANGAEPLGQSPEDWARNGQTLGAGEIFIQSIDRDGMLEGYDIELIRRVSDAVDIPVLACGGAGNWQHFVEGFEQGSAQAVCTTNIYHFTESSIRSAKQFLHAAGIHVRK
jgi:cyclase